MASFTKHQLISDIILRITKSKPSDDLEIEPTQIAFWIDQLLPSMVQQVLNNKLINGGTIDPAYICVEECVSPSLKLKDCVDCQNNVYICLKNVPLELYRDKGVIRVADEDGQWADKVTLEELDNLRQLRFSKPSLKNIKYHRVKGTLYFHGITSNTYHLFNFNIAYVPSQNVSALSDSDVVYVGDDILAPLADALEARLRRQMYQSDEDLENNGKQDLDVNGQ